MLLPETTGAAPAIERSYFVATVPVRIDRTLSNSNRNRPANIVSTFRA